MKNRGRRPRKTLKFTLNAAHTSYLKRKREMADEKRRRGRQLLVWLKLKELLQARAATVEGQRKRQSSLQ